MMTRKIIRIDPADPDPDSIAGAGKILQNNGVVIFPAQYLYGVAVNALNEKAVQTVFHIKKRSAGNPILVLVPDRHMITELVTTIPDSAEKLMAAFWPGNLTLVFTARSHIPSLLTAGTGKIGIRLPVHPVARSLVNALNFPLTGTSANRSGKESCHQIQTLDPAIIDMADLVLDAGILKGGRGSTVVDVTTSPVTLIREGIITASRINQALAQ